METSTFLGSLQKFEGAAGEFKGALSPRNPLILSPGHFCREPKCIFKSYLNMLCMYIEISKILASRASRVLARISKMPVQNSNFNIFARPDLATQLLQILIPTSFNSLLCQKGHFPGNFWFFFTSVWLPWQGIWILCFISQGKHTCFMVVILVCIVISLEKRDAPTIFNCLFCLPSF